MWSLAFVLVFVLFGMALANNTHLIIMVVFAFAAVMILRALRSKK